ncbi:hypothetical protein EFE32_00500 [Lactococcus lactis subsp. lactis]|uniref:toprim domain-containing protein n=1 Tax=Lactococcus lactis TaxID=1358 RepID=UPI00223B124B|nr:toprim domain-containing protein [Lactococcus lactis]MCT0015361.1 hypothetical protein [Lactococcus lactis subsp. lactis]
MINYFTLTEEYFKYLQKKTNGEILWNKNEKRPYGLIMEVGKIDFYVPFTHDLRINRFPFLKDASYQVPSEELGYSTAGLDFQHAIPIVQSDTEAGFILANQSVFPDQKFFVKNKEAEIVNKFSKYVRDYEKYISTPLKDKTKENLGFNPKIYTYSTLQYFHKELGIEASQQLKNTQEVTHKPTQQISKKHSSRSMLITDEMKKQAKNTSILDYVKYYGIPVRRTSGSEYELVEQKNVKFDTRKNLFQDYNPSHNAGGDMIDFAKYIDGFNFPKAIQKICAVDGSGTYDFSKNQSEPFVMPQIFEEDNRLNEAMIYLVNERKFESSTIKKMAANGLIKQTKNKEVAFIWADGPEDVGMTLQGTKLLDYRSDIKETGLGDFIKEYTWKVGIGAKGLERPLETGKAETKSLAEEAVQTFLEEQRPYKKQIWRNSTTGHGFNFRSGPTDLEAKGKIVFSEAAIDAISYFELKGQEFDEKTRVHYQSLEGLKDNIFFKSIERYEERYSKLPEEIILAVDNDDAGDAFVRKILSDKRVKDYQTKGMKVKREKPGIGKDFNDELKQTKIINRRDIQRSGIHKGTQI